MKLNKYLAFLLPLLLLSCTNDLWHNTTPSGGVTVGFMAGGVDSRTSINEDGISTSWNIGDNVALWATAEDGSSVLSAEPFQLYYRDIPASKALFTKTLGSAMDEGNYNYYATYPTPNEVNGTKATFTLPATQDGMISSGAAIMIATPTQGSKLGIVTGAPNSSNAYEIEDVRLSLQMNHAMHALKFFIPSDKWGFAEGEKVEHIEFAMPQDIAGDVTLDYTNPSATPEVTNGKNSINLILANPISASTSAADIDFAAAAIIPTEAFSENDQMYVKVYSKTEVARYYISLAGRGAMQAGHITPIALDCSSPSPLPRLLFRIEGNNLGEQPYKITLTSSSTLSKWTSTSNHVYTYYTGSESKIIANGSGFDIAYDEAYISTLSGKQVTVTYESANAIVSNTITMPSMSAGNDYTINLTVPYLFAEDFSSLKKYDGDYTGGPYTSTGAASTAGRDLSQYGLSAGWTGARTGCDAEGVAILVSGRVDNVIAGATRAYGRLDSPALNAIKPNKSVNVKVSFTYSGREEENIDYYYPVAKIGYTLDTGILNGYATQFNNDQAFTGLSGMTDIPSVPTNGSASAATNSMTYSINECTANHRISWHVMQYGYKAWKINNDYGVLYVDNIKVQIVK